jgi:hypothetical protein
MLSLNLTAACAVPRVLWHGRLEGFLRESHANSSAVLTKSKSPQVYGQSLFTATLHGQCTSSASKASQPFASTISFYRLHQQGFHKLIATHHLPSRSLALTPLDPKPLFASIHRYNAISSTRTRSDDMIYFSEGAQYIYRHQSEWTAS